jgi:hypothetical protein
MEQEERVLCKDAVYAAYARQTRWPDTAFHLLTSSVNRTEQYAGLPLEMPSARRNSWIFDPTSWVTLVARRTVDYAFLP